MVEIFFLLCYSRSSQTDRGEVVMNSQSVDIPKGTVVVRDDESLFISILFSVEACKYYALDHLQPLFSQGEDLDDILYYFLYNKENHNKTFIIYVENKKVNGQTFLILKDFELEKYKEFRYLESNIVNVFVIGNREFNTIFGKINLFEEELINYCRKYSDCLRNLEYSFDPEDEDEAHDAVSKIPEYICKINNPSEEVQLVAVRKHGSTIQYIDNPSEEVQVVAVNQNPWAIEFIDNPSEEVQLAAVKKGSYAIKLIENPSDELQLFALKNTWDKHFYEEFIKDLPNKTEWFYKEFNRLKLIKGPLKLSKSTKII